MQNITILVPNTPPTIVMISAAFVILETMVWGPEEGCILSIAFLVHDGLYWCMVVCINHDISGVRHIVQCVSEVLTRVSSDVSGNDRPATMAFANSAQRIAWAAVRPRPSTIAELVRIASRTLA